MSAPLPINSPLKNSSMSRPSSRSSFRSGSPGFNPAPLDDPVSLRTAMSTLKHEIRLKQAQYQTMESQLLKGPRPLPPSPTSSLLALSASLNGMSTTPTSRRQGVSDIQEGIPMSFGVGNANLNGSTTKRSGSPTRSMSRIPISAVTQARALAESGTSPRPTLSTLPSDPSTSTLNGNLSASNVTPTTYLDPPSPSSANGNRRSLGGGNTTKVLADLQAGVVTARNALENTKNQLRLSQRTVAQLTRQNEDLKDGRERLRLENEGLNSVVARKERLLQEVLERARRAESEAANLKAQLKNETTNSKKALRDMETTVAESTAISSKCEREYITLKDAVKGLQEGWKADVERLRVEIQKKEEGWKKEIDEVNLKYRSFVKLTQSAQAERTKLESLKAESRTLDTQFEAAMREELGSLTEAVKKSNADSDKAAITADYLATELARIRRLMRSTGLSQDDGLPPHADSTSEPPAGPLPPG